MKPSLSENKIRFKGIRKMRAQLRVSTNFLTVPRNSKVRQIFVRLISLINGPGHAKMCFIPYTNNKSADQPAHPRSLISTFVVRCLDSMICILAISKVSRVYLASIAEQVGLNVTWLKIPEDTFLRDMAQILTVSLKVKLTPLTRFIIQNF